MTHLDMLDRLNIRMFQDQCCCIPADLDCFDLYPAVDDLVGQGLIDPRIVNRPPAQPQQLNTLDTCPAGYKTCCYAPDLDLTVFQVDKLP